MFNIYIYIYIYIYNREYITTSKLRKDIFNNSMFNHMINDNKCVMPNLTFLIHETLQSYEGEHFTNELIECPCNFI